jgi:hypothetical protein
MTDRFDTFVKQLAEPAPRRRVLLGLGGLTLGSVGFLTTREPAAARSCGKRCRRKCKGRKPKCHDRCVDRCKNH